MNPVPGLGRLAFVHVLSRLADLERALAEDGDEQAGLRASFAEAAKQDGLVTREEAAAHLRVSKKTVQRMDADGRLRRCRNLGSAVRYRASDVLGLASAR